MICKARQCQHAIKNLVTDHLFLVVAVAGNIQPHGRSENVVLLKSGDSRRRDSAVGLALGLAFALGVTRIIVPLLYGIGANDPVTVVSVVTLLGAMSLVASYFPAHRAMRRNPMTAIREL